MSKFLIGISGMAAGVTGLLALFDRESIWVWIFAILSIPFGMVVSGIIFMGVGALLLAPFVGLDRLDQEFGNDE